MTTLVEAYDAGLFDLDGCLMHGSRPIPHAAAAVDAARDAGWHIAFVTNNASRTAEQVVAHLATVDVTAAVDEVVSSPQVAARLLVDQLGEGATVLVVGGEPLADEVAAVGLVPVSSVDEDPVAVIQGWSPDLSWPLLAEGAYALGRGAVWMATNTDSTLPTEKGLAPGNGAMVHCLVLTSGREPQVAGKPGPGMFEIAARRCEATQPLVVGDRLDTDIEGGNRAGFDTLLVLTGVHRIRDALYTTPVRRPTHLAPDLRDLSRERPDTIVEDDTATSTGPDGSGNARLEHGDLVVSDTGIGAARAALALIGRRFPEQAFTGAVRTESGDDAFTPA